MGDRKNINKPEEYPIEGLPTGTYVRSHRLNKLGVITDAFYEEPEVNNQKIIVYTILILPQIANMYSGPLDTEQFYVTNEYEYEITAYLMIKPIDVTDIMIRIEGDPFP
jgi:hypothetical protein